MAKTNQPRRHVFISYKREDAQSAGLLRQALRAESVEVWWDEQLQTGEQWEEKIDQALLQAEAIVVLWSSRSVASDWVRHEASIGKIRNILVHAKIDATDIPVPFQSIQAVDLSDWTGGEDDAEFRKILNAIARLRKERRARANARIATLGLLLVLAFGLGAGTVWFGKPLVQQTAEVDSGEEVDGSPLDLRIIDRELDKSIRKVLVPTFTDTLVNYGGSTDGDYLDGIATLFSAKLSSRYDTEFVKMDPDREYGFASVSQLFSNASAVEASGVLVGNVHKYQDERPDIGQKALLSITVELFDAEGNKAWIASQTVSGRTAKPIGDPPLDGVEAIELLEAMMTTLALRLDHESK